MFSMHFYVSKKSELISCHVTFPFKIMSASTHSEFTFIMNPISLLRMEVRSIGCGSTVLSEVLTDRDIITVSAGFLHNK